MSDSDSSLGLDDGPVLRPRGWRTHDHLEPNIRDKIRYIEEHVTRLPGMQILIEVPATMRINPNHPDIDVTSIIVELNVPTCWARITKHWRMSQIETRDAIDADECISSLNWSLSTGTRHPETYIPPQPRHRGPPGRPPRGMTMDILQTLESLHRRVSLLECRKN